MAILINNSARQYSVRGLSRDKGNRVKIVLAPGANEVEDVHYGNFVSRKGVVINDYLANLVEEGEVSLGDEDSVDIDDDVNEVPTVSTPVRKAGKGGKGKGGKSKSDTDTDE